MKQLPRGAIWPTMWLTLAMCMLGCTQVTDESATTNGAELDTDLDAREWVQHFPGGDTLCSDGSPFSFWVRPGKQQQLLFYLQGGGACWFRENCDPQMRPSYTVNLAAENPGVRSGIFDYGNTANPFRDYTAVYVPYCSGDVHLGARDTQYPAVEPGQQPLTRYHRGLANVGSVLQWTYANLTEVDDIFVTGSSAGAIPSPYYAAVLAEHYAEAAVTQLGDGAGGYRRINDTAQALPHQSWGTVDALAQQPGYTDLTLSNFNYESLYQRAAALQPRIRFARYDTAEDSVQKQFLALSGATVASLNAELQANHKTIADQVERYASYVAGGEVHTILRRPEFYSFTVGDRAVLDWVSDLAAGKSVTNVRCDDCRLQQYSGYPINDAFRDLWLSWQAPQQQVAPFQIFDNLYYVGIDWVAAYVLQTSQGLILIDSLYGKWVPQLYANMRQLGLDPADIKYAIATHGHFDHSGGLADVQARFGATVVLSEADWRLLEQPAEHPLMAQGLPQRKAGQGIVAADGQVITLGDTQVTLLATPGHTPGVLSLLYEVHDGADVYQALTLGGVGLNFSGVPQSEAYVASYERLVTLQATQKISVSLPNHAAMGRVFERRDRLAARTQGAPHPYVDSASLAADLAKFLKGGRAKLAAERAGAATDPVAELTKVLAN